MNQRITPWLYAASAVALGLVVAGTAVQVTGRRKLRRRRKPSQGRTQSATRGSSLQPAPKDRGTKLARATEASSLTGAQVTRREDEPPEIVLEAGTSIIGEGSGNAATTEQLDAAVAELQAIMEGIDEDSGIISIDEEDSDSYVNVDDWVEETTNDAESGFGDTPAPTHEPHTHEGAGRQGDARSSDRAADNPDDAGESNDRVAGSAEPQTGSKKRGRHRRHHDG